MSEFDLIPAEYRQIRDLKNKTKVFFIVFATLIVLIIISKVMLENNINKLGSSVKNFQQDKQIIQQEQQRFNDLSQSIKTLNSRLQILNGLRSGLPVVDSFRLLDRVLTDDIWIDSWDFLREGEWQEAKPETVNTGYFIVIPKTENKPEQAWRLNTNMVIKGKAMSHSILAEFVQKLLKQPEIDDVKVNRTSLRQYTATSVVVFTLAISTKNVNITAK